MWVKWCEKQLLSWMLDDLTHGTQVFSSKWFNVATTQNNRPTRQIHACHVSIYCRCKCMHKKDHRLENTYLRASRWWHSQILRHGSASCWGCSWGACGACGAAESLQHIPRHHQHQQEEICLSLHSACEVLAGSSMGNACQLDRCDACNSTCHSTALTSEHSADPGSAPHLRKNLCCHVYSTVTTSNHSTSTEKQESQQQWNHWGDHTELKAWRVNTFKFTPPRNRRRLRPPFLCRASHSSLPVCYFIYPGKSRITHI